MKSLYKNIANILLIFTGILIIKCNSFAQQQYLNWNFGGNAALNFSTGSPVVVTGSALNTVEGCASISDNMGNLLFYTDGITVWDKTNTQMPNGTGLFGNASATQSALIVPNPGNMNQYYIFTSDLQAGLGTNWYLEDMTLNGGFGDRSE